jgi:hypothetical protein
MVDSGEKSQTEVAELFDVSKATLSRLITRAHTNGSATAESKPGPHASKDHVGLRARARAGVGILGVNGVRGKTGEAIISVMTLSRSRFTPAGLIMRASLPL